VATIETTAPAATGLAATPAWRRWSILILLALGAVFAFVDRTNISSALTTPDFKAHFSLTNLERGWINSAFFWAYACLQIPMGWAVDKYGVKIPYTIGIIVWSAATALAAFTNTIPELIIARVVVGAGEAVVVPASYRWIRSNFKENQNGLAVGIYMLGTKLGPAIGAPLSAWLILAHGWRAMFLILGVIGLVWLVPWQLLLKDDRPSKDAASVAKRKAAQLSFATILKSPMVWGSIIINFCYNYFTFYCMTWMPAYFVEHRGFSLAKMGLFSFFSFIGIAIVALVSGWVADRIIATGKDPVFVRKTFVIAGFVVACTELLGVLTTSQNVAAFWAIVSLSGLGLATANHLALVRLTLIPPQAAGRVTGVQNVSTSLAGIATPVVSGWLLDVTGSYVGPMLAIFVFLVIGAVTCIVLLRREWAPKAPEVPSEAAA
jgi:ACS family D-galactonate transporter-like MFS transporter